MPGKGNLNYRRDDDGRWHYLPGEVAAARWGMGYIVRLAEDNNPILVDTGAGTGVASYAGARGARDERAATGGAL